MKRAVPILSAALLVAIAGCSQSSGTGALPAKTDALASSQHGEIAASNACPCYKLLHNFAGGADGAVPNELTLFDGLFYSTTIYGGAGNFGTVYTLSTDGAENVLYQFKGRPDGSDVGVGLTRANGLLFGTTITGGVHGVGTVYSVSPDGTERVIHSFADADGARAGNDVLVNVNGTLYGEIVDDGAYHHRGSVFSITPSGVFRVLHSFGDHSGDGAFPGGGFEVVNGVLYGVTALGGAHGFGTVFRLTTSGNETVLHSFAGGADGYSPIYPPTYLNGMFYGTTFGDGNNNFGTIYRMSTQGAESVIHTFSNPGPSYPASGLAVLNGTLYGSTSSGGKINAGTIYSVTPGGAVTILHEFAGAPNDGATPFLSNLTALNGVLYGVTEAGGTSNKGTAFSLRP